MPGFTPLPHRLPPPSMLPLMARDRKMAFEQAAQYEIQCRDQHIRELEMEIVRLKVKLEQKEKDVKMAMNMIMVAGRASEREQADEEPWTRPRINIDELRARSAMNDNGWEGAHACFGPTQRSYDRQRQTRPSYFADGVAEAAGWGQSAEQDNNGSHKDGDARTRTSAVSNRGRPRDHSVVGSETNRHGWGDSVSKHSVHPAESLLDLEDDSETLRGANAWGDDPNTWTMPAPLPPLSPIAGAARVASNGVFTTEKIASGSPFGSAESKPGTAKPNFQHLFPDDSEDEGKTAPFPDYDELKAKQDYEAKQQNILMRSSLPDFISKLPEVSPQMHVKTPQRPVDVPRGPPRDRIASQESDYQVDATKVDVSSGLVTPLSNESNHLNPQDISLEVGHDYMPAHRGGRAPYNTSSEESDERPFRYNMNKAAPWSAEAVKYVPVEVQNNFLRTVMVYNLPPQVDVSEITAPVGEAPLLSIKLMPTMGMKGRKKDGTTGVLPTMTAMMIFAVDTSAEQFAFDTERRPLVIRGRTALVKLLETPTYPAGLPDRAYATAPGRLLSRRIRFHQPGLIPADEFDDTLAGNSYGYKQPGWIVSKDMQKMAGKNMITIEFASVATARFAWEQFGWLQEFQGCEPRWVFDHEARAMDRYRRELRTREDDDHSDMETMQDAEMLAGGLEMETKVGLTGSKHAGGEVGRVDVVRHPEVPSFGALPDFCRPKVTKTIELDY